MTNFLEQQAANRRRSQWLVAGFILFFAWVGFGGDLAFGLLTADSPPTAYHHVVPFIGIITSLLAIGICWHAQHKGAERVLWATGAWEIIDPATPEQTQYVNVVEEMAIAAGIPRPRIWIVPEEDPNAFATGTDPAHANIAATDGLLALLSRDELQGVVAHEMAHIQNEDTRLMTLLAGMIGAILLVSDGSRRFLGGSNRSLGGRKGGGGKGAAGMVVLVVWLISLIIAPLIARVLAMSVSRKREYLADATAAQFTRNPLALASALEKLDSATPATRSIGRGAAHLCIVDPGERSISDVDGLVGDVFSSHPPIRQRIIRLKGMGFAFAKAAVGQTA
ncbi:MAG TPA: M48 family metallopeptidase [Gemmatimonadales bacterium]|jgi:heat shock protein HtpX|nr:M48 family metallopeptidase [Gemmatimonadales bacterium]